MERAKKRKEDRMRKYSVPLEEQGSLAGLGLGGGRRGFSGGLILLHDDGLGGGGGDDNGSLRTGGGLPEGDGEAWGPRV